MSPIQKLNSLFKMGIITPETMLRIIEAMVIVVETDYSRSIQIVIYGLDGKTYTIKVKPKELLGFGLEVGTDDDGPLDDPKDDSNGGGQGPVHPHDPTLDNELGDFPDGVFGRSGSSTHVPFRIVSGDSQQAA